MDRKVKEFLISKLTTSFSDIGYVLSILLSENDGTAEKDRSFREECSPEDRTGILDGIVHDAAESMKRLTASTETTAHKQIEDGKTAEEPKTEKPASTKTKRSQGSKAAKAAAEEKKEETKAEENAPHTAATPEAEEKKENVTVTEATADTPSPVSTPETETKSAEDLLKALKDDMTALALRGKGNAIQKGLADYGIRKISEVKTEDYDDFRTRVYYYADELEVQDA